MWGQVRILRDARIAHRDLRSANVFMTAEGEPMMIDFGFGEVSASDDLLDQDVAQLILSTAIDVGAQRAVAAAVEVLGPEAVAASAPRMQAPALSGATQTALRAHKGLLDETREEVKTQTGIDTIELAKLERANAKTILTVVMAFGVLWFLIPQIAELPRLTAQLRQANWTLAAVAIGFSLLTYVGSALSMASSVAQRIPVIRATLVALAGSFVNRVSPAKVGGMALNLRFLQKSGVPTAVASTSIGLYSIVGGITHITLLVIFSVWAGKTVDLMEFLPSKAILLAAAGVVLGLIGVVAFVPKVRLFIAEKVRPEAKKAGANVRGMLEHPLRLVLIVVGSAAPVPELHRGAGRQHPGLRRPDRAARGRGDLPGRGVHRQRGADPRRCGGGRGSPDRWADCCRGAERGRGPERVPVPAGHVLDPGPARMGRLLLAAAP